MISFDLECSHGHRFEGIFKDYQAYDKQLNNNMITCPFCQDLKIKRLFTGCSIQSTSLKSTANLPAQKEAPNVFEMLRMMKDHVKNNFENVGKDFADTARAMYYGVEEERNIYGESTAEEVKDLIEEGVKVLPIPVIDKVEN